VRLFIERFQQEAKPILRNPLRFMQETLLRAHAALGSYASQFSMLETPRTTCVAVVVQGNHAYWTHVGDSRFYLLRQGRLIGATKDHSKVQYLVDQGIIAPQDVATHPDRNKVFSCLGGIAEPVIDISKRTPLDNGDILILCTDGLWSVYPVGEMSTMLTSTPILTTAPQIMREAEERGGPEGDNLSAIIVRWGPETLADQPSTTTDTLELGQFETQLEKTVTLTDRAGMQRDLTDDEIERAIAEIQSTIQKYRK
jgi:serine/threonine protein phosphatase PrpC